jgi:pimeloyl-ACP methyl ester carboxylesterase
MRDILLAGLPVTERRINVAGVATNILEGGDGPPLLFLHGGIEVGGVYWAPLLPVLAKHHRVIVPDVPGLGESEPFSRPIDQAQFDRWFSILLDRICSPGAWPRGPHVVAHSLLGTFATSFAARHGDRLQGLTIYGAPGVGPYRMPLGLMFAAIMFDLRPSQSAQARFLRWVFIDPAVTQAQHPQWFAAFNAYCVERGKQPHVKRTMRALVKAGTQRLPVADLARIPVPTTLLWGRADRMVPIATAQAVAAELGWPLHVVEDAGHAPHLERPDAFLETLSDALAPGHGPGAHTPKLNFVLGGVS